MDPAVPMAGCQTPLDVLERLLRGTEARATFDELTRGEPGGNNNPEGRNQYRAEEGGEVNRDNVTVDLAIESKEGSPPDGLNSAPDCPPRDYSREAAEQR